VPKTADGEADFVAADKMSPKLVWADILGVGVKFWDSGFFKDGRIEENAKRLPAAIDIRENKRKADKYICFDIKIILTQKQLFLS